MMGSPFLFLTLLALVSSAPVVPSAGEGGGGADGVPADGGEHEDDDAAVGAVRYMRRFGYLESVTPEGEALYAKDTIREALLLVQKFGAIEQTGELDGDTVRLMRSPRCGVQDFVNVSSSGQERKKRYVIGSEGWKKRNVTYRLVNWSPKLGKATTETEFQKAFDAWSGYSRLKFAPAQPYIHADIEIVFARGPHGDGYPMDGPGGVLAHAFYPYEAGHWGGDMHFDDDEEWKVKPALDQGVDIFTVAVHELGHSLGLAHSFVSASVMFPYYKGHQSNFRLDMDDIYGLYQLYRKQFWISDGDRLIQNSPRPLTDYGLPAALERVHSAMVWGKNGKTFIFSADRYWRFNESTTIMDEGYPKSLTRWRGVPEDLDAALTWTDGATYFFHDSMFWRFDNTLIKTEDGFPLATSEVWFDCP